jgi:hypothetical protein
MVRTDQQNSQRTQITQTQPNSIGGAIPFKKPMDSADFSAER